ncbi:ankyrin repeat domain-containing protein [Gordonia sputi]
MRSLLGQSDCVSGALGEDHDREGRTPLHYAVHADRDFDSARLLVDPGGDPNALDNRGRNPLVFASDSSVPRNAHSGARVGPGDGGTTERTG